MDTNQCSQEDELLLTSHVRLTRTHHLMRSPISDHCALIGFIGVTARVSWRTLVLSCLVCREQVARGDDGPRAISPDSAAARRACRASREPRSSAALALGVAVAAAAPALRRERRLCLLSLSGARDAAAARARHRRAADLLSAARTSAQASHAQRG